MIKSKRVGEKCLADEDCEGPYYQCLQGKCTCPSDFEEYSLDEKLKVCRPARDEVDAKCQTKCKDPLLCQNGKCICFKGVVSGKKCSIQCPSGQVAVGQECRTLSTSLGGKCSSDTDCTIAASYCNGGHCDCVGGAQRTCPDGTAPSQVCRKIMVNDANALANLDKQDTCPRGYGCFTYGKPDIGHCCPLYCPYGKPDLTKSCSASAASASRCPEQSTHFCQLFEDRGTKNAICCPRPCREPTPLFINGACYPAFYKMTDDRTKISLKI
uniref:EB domain-containing protein n=1 Tax=Romanomermis culicivorax TaxID=13658 RepID=A0A915L961_ROMCU